MIPSMASHATGAGKRLWKIMCIAGSVPSPSAEDASGIDMGSLSTWRCRWITSGFALNAEAAAALVALTGTHLLNTLTNVSYFVLIPSTYALYDYVLHCLVLHSMHFMILCNVMYCIVFYAFYDCM